MKWFVCTSVAGLAVAVTACSGADQVEPNCDHPALFEKSPGAALEGSGWHRIYVQGGESTPDSDGRFGMTENRNETANGDHFLLSQGALVEWRYPIVDALTGHVFFHVARVDDLGVIAHYSLSVVRADETTELVSVDDPDTGEMGYVPFEECFFGVGGDVAAQAGDHLLLRVSNATGGMLGVVVRSPDYYTWVDVEVQ